ncbi:facilitated trehalose transporter Tret1-like [Copidosoma floridanum]|uniref:facilitated trehalose transporter Tret1-like n=1 Tax=Copidosoma floridanum TaxID=29053 RepID=UPI0006C94C36|nr:facilitated trehalose transporter Tret1-like [Copidosoma floridanum]
MRYLIVLDSWIHWIATFAVFVLMTQVGICIGWVAPNIAKLMDEDSDIPLDTDQVSWMVSIAPLVGILGAVASALGVEFLGSRRVILAAFTVMSASWVCMMAANSVAWLYVARGLTGLVLSASYSCFSIYLGEIADPKIRGTLVSVAAGGNPFGIVVGTVAETYLPRRASSSMYLVLCLMALLLMLWLQDTPYYLTRKGLAERARASVVFYRPGCDVDKEVLEIGAFVECHAVGGSFRTKLRDLNAPAVRWSFFVIVTLFALPHVSGTMNLSSYMEVILRKARSRLVEPERFVIYANVTSVLSTLLTFKLIDVLGRRVLLVVSGIGTFVAMGGLGLHFYLLGAGFDPEGLQWLPVVSILGYLVTYAVGFSPVPSTVLSELFADNAKSVAALVATLSAPFFSFVVTKAYQPMVDRVGEAYVFWIHALFGFAAVPYALFVLPETRGKTFQEIQDALTGK